MIKQKKGTAFH